MLGKQRVDEFARRMRKIREQPEGPVDLRGQNSGHPRTKDRTPEEEISYLKHQVTLQKQQIETLKKRILSIARQPKLRSRKISTHSNINRKGSQSLDYQVAM